MSNKKNEVEDIYGTSERKNTQGSIEKKKSVFHTINKEEYEKSNIEARGEIDYEHQKVLEEQKRQSRQRPKREKGQSTNTVLEEEIEESPAQKNHNKRDQSQEEYEEVEEEEEYGDEEQQQAEDQNEDEDDNENELSRNSMK